jgi:hypothetical protein
MTVMSQRDALAWAMGVTLGLGLVSPAAGGAFGLKAKVSTLGVGLEGIFGVTEQLHVRVGGNYLDYDPSKTINTSDVDYDPDISFRSATGTLDWYPLGGTFRLFAGLMYNKNDIDVTGKPAFSGSVRIGGIDFNVADIGELKGDIDFNTAVPYIGVGWGNALNSKGSIRLSLDLGVGYQGSPDVSLEASNDTLANDPAFQSALSREEDDLNDKVDKYRYYPIIALGLSYAF